MTRAELSIRHYAWELVRYLRAHVPGFEDCYAQQTSSHLAAQMARHQRLVHWVVRRQWLGNLSFRDALHEGRIGLWSAWRHYDPQRGTAFGS